MRFMNFRKEQEFLREFSHCLRLRKMKMKGKRKRERKTGATFWRGIGYERRCGVVMQGAAAGGD